MTRAWFLAGLLAACGVQSDAEDLVLVKFQQNELGNVALNEELAFFFSRELEPSSITSDSLRVLDAAGHEVRGERRVRRDSLLFLPELPRQPDLSDGAFVPGARYTVVLGGFPRPDGIRARDGALLSATLELTFSTAAIGESALFLSSFSTPFPLRCRGRGSPLVLEDGRIVLEAREPIDPSQVPKVRFELRRGREVLPARLELVRNEREYAELMVVPERDAAGTERLEPGTYGLSLPGLPTLGGRRLETAWRDVLPLIVPDRRQRVDFAAERAPELPGGCDGTIQVLPDGSGLELRYPAAAGSGEHGAVSLLSPPDGRDLAATRLVVPAGASVDLSAVRGPLVLRSQTALEIAGSLVRRSPADARRGDGRAQELRELADRLSDLPAGDPSRPPFGAWLDEILASDLDWTVLVAGGDLRVPVGGSLEVDGPLVLVAGGWIRVSGQVSAGGDLWRTPEVAGGFATHAAPARLLPFRLEPPTKNPLAVPFRAGFTARLSPARAELEPVLAAPLVAGAGVRLTSEVEARAGQPALLRVRFELQPQPGTPWLPPRCGVELEPGRARTP